MDRTHSLYMDTLPFTRVTQFSPSPPPFESKPWAPHLLGRAPPTPIFRERQSKPRRKSISIPRPTSDESSPPSSPVGRPAKVPRLRVSTTGIPARVPSLWVPSRSSIEFARAATHNGHAIALERLAANERYARRHHNLLRPAAAQQPRSTAAGRAAQPARPSSRTPICVNPPD